VYAVPDDPAQAAREKINVKVEVSVGGAAAKAVLSCDVTLSTGMMDGTLNVVVLRRRDCQAFPLTNSLLETDAAVVDALFADSGYRATSAEPSSTGYRFLMAESLADSAAQRNGSRPTAGPSPSEGLLVLQVKFIPADASKLGAPLMELHRFAITGLKIPSFGPVKIALDANFLGFAINTEITFDPFAWIKGLVEILKNIPWEQLFKSAEQWLKSRVTKIVNWKP